MSDAPNIPNDLPNTEAPTGATKVQRRSLATVTPRSVRFLVPGLVPLRTLTLLAGVGGLGKSTLAVTWAAAMTRGDLPDIEPADVLFVSYEDTAEEIIRPRLEAARADLSRCHELYVDPEEGSLVLPRHLGDLEVHVRETGSRLLIVDPIIAAFDLSLDAHKDQHVRAVLAQLAGIVETTHCAAVMVGHLNKAPTGDAYLRVANSTAFWNASRSVVLVTEDGEDGDQRLVTQRKTNWSRMAGVQRHVIETVTLETIDPDTGDPIETSRMRYVEEATDIDPNNVLAAPAERKTAGATAFLHSALSDGEWHDSAGLKSLAASQGLSDRTVKRAAQELGVENDRRGFPSTTWWRLVGPGSIPNAGPSVSRLAVPHEHTGSDPSESHSGQLFGAKDHGPSEEKEAA